jgi:hypothetical protein
MTEFEFFNFLIEIWICLSLFLDFRPINSDVFLVWVQKNVSWEITSLLTPSLVPPLRDQRLFPERQDGRVQVPRQGGNYCAGIRATAERASSTSWRRWRSSRSFCDSYPIWPTSIIVFMAAPWTRPSYQRWMGSFQVLTWGTGAVPVAVISPLISLKD